MRTLPNVREYSISGADRAGFEPIEMSPSDALSKAIPRQRLLEPQLRRLPAGAGYGLALVSAFLLHGAVLSVVYFENWFAPSSEMKTAEIPIEIVAEPPPQPKPDGPEAKPDPSPPMQSIEEEPATDAPRAANDEKVERKTPDKETNTPPAPTPTTEQNPGGPAGKESTETARQEAPQAAQTSWARSDDKPDAEVVSAVESELQKAEQEARAEPQPQPQLAGSEMFPAWSIGQQSPIFDALRDSELASAAEATPVAGGSAKSTYLTILYGMIMPHMRSPSDVHPGASKIEGVVTFSIDGRGNLGDRRIRRSSGFHDLDSAALAALAEAAPFPPPPHGLPIKLTFTYGAN